MAGYVLLPRSPGRGPTHRLATMAAAKRDKTNNLSRGQKVGWGITKQQSTIFGEYDEELDEEAGKWLALCPGYGAPFFYDGATGERLYSAFV